MTSTDTQNILIIANFLKNIIRKNDFSKNNSYKNNDQDDDDVDMEDSTSPTLHSEINYDWNEIINVDIIKNQQMEDPFLRIIIKKINGDDALLRTIPKYLQTQVHNREYFINEKGLLCHKPNNCVVIPPPIRMKLIQCYHSNLLVNHQGLGRLY